MNSRKYGFLYFYCIFSIMKLVFTVRKIGEKIRSCWEIFILGGIFEQFGFECTNNNTKWESCKWKKDMNEKNDFLLQSSFSLLTISLHSHS